MESKDPKNDNRDGRTLETKDLWTKSVVKEIIIMKILLVY
jgi:hypothetical protein